MGMRMQRRDLTKFFAGLLAGAFVGSSRGEGAQLQPQNSPEGNVNNENRVLEEALLAIPPKAGGVHEHAWEAHGTLQLAPSAGGTAIPISICRLCGVLGRPLADSSPE